MWERFLDRWTRIKALMIKEFQAVLTDKRNRNMLFIPPVVQLVLFAFTATLEVKNITMVVQDKDNTTISKELVSKFQGSPRFVRIYYVNSREDLNRLINSQKVFIAMTIPNNFAHDLYANNNAKVQFILDGRKTNAASIVLGYANSIINEFQSELSGRQISSKINVQVRNWFNSNLNYRWFIVISMCGTLTMSMVLSLTALAVAKEREFGTFNQIIVSPLKPWEILLAKTIPAMCFSLTVMTLILFIAIFGFRIPFVGSILYLLISVLVFLLAMSAIGLFISTICRTQQQAILGVFVVMMPCMLLSGYISPVENMPIFLQKITLINPVRHFLVLNKGIFSKDMTFAMIFENLWPLIVLSIVSLGFSTWYFNRKLE